MCPTVNADVPFGLFHDDVTDDCLFCPYIAAVRQDERAKALDAARDAVGNVPCQTTTHGDDWRDIPGSVVMREALAAIDRLREGKK